MKRVAFLIIFFLFLLAVLLIDMREVLAPRLEAVSTSPEQSFSILILGDIMLDRTVAERIELYGADYPFINMPRVFGENDFIVANLEGVFSQNASVSRISNEILQFTFDPSLAPTLRKWGIDAVSQANNHTMDFGREGAEESRRYLRQAEITPFGDYFNDLDLVAVKELGGKKVAFLGYNEFAPGDDERFYSLVAKTKAENDFVIVMPHWGEEYTPTSTERVHAIAKRFIDVGADVVVGAHPHVIQETEIYKGKLIVYSLGNFIFDQDFSRATTEGLGLRIILDGREVRFDLLPFAINRSQVVPMSEDRKVQVLRTLRIP
jgi:poly-gamma-glutamate synthesis protein (capsule biosynthesis protein)